MGKNTGRPDAVVWMTAAVFVLVAGCSTTGPATTGTSASGSSTSVSPSADVTQFQTDLAAAVTARPPDYSTLERLMGEQFEILTWHGNGEQMTPAEAIVQLRDWLITPTGSVTCSSDRDRIDTALGVDPFEFYRGFASGFVLADGVGDGSDQALLVVARDATGRLYWSGMLLAWGGFDVAYPDE